MSKERSAGFTLIEVVVTMFVMGVGLLGMAGLQVKSIKDITDTATRSQALWIVSELAERIRANPDGQVSGYNQTLTTVSCSTSPPKLCSDIGNADASTSCSVNDMAYFDVWEVFCGHQENDVMTSSVDALKLTSVTTGCSGTCTPYSDFSVTVIWDSLAGKSVV